MSSFEALARAHAADLDREIATASRSDLLLLLLSTPRAAPPARRSAIARYRRAVVRGWHAAVDPAVDWMAVHSRPR